MMSAMRRIGIAQSICHEYGSPITAWMMTKTNSVGINLKSAMTVAEIGSMMRGNEVFRIKR